jgi:predicted nucleic acid-binding protein
LLSETIGSALRHCLPERHITTFRYRDDVDLPFDPEAAPSLPLLLDTTYYLDRGRGKLPAAIERLVVARRQLVYNCGVVCAELAISMGLLDPAGSRFRESIAIIRHHLDEMETGKTVSPSAAAWAEAALLAGILARTQGLAVPKKTLSPDQECCQKGRRRELLLDALLYITAIEHDMLLISGNIRHMDLLAQLRPSNNLLLYRPVADTARAG